MVKASTSLDEWREYFSSSDSDIFEIIKHAIMVAAADHPRDFRLKRDGIAELLFSTELVKCCGCDRVELAVLPSDDPVEGSGDEKCKCETQSREIEDAKMRKEDGRDDDDDNDRKEANVDRISDQSYVDVEALSDEIEEEMKMVEEVSRIKGIIDNSDEESDIVLFQFLRRLQLMHLPVDILSNTEVAKSVYALRGHASKDVSNLARALIGEWRNMVETWVDVTAEIAGAESTKGSPKMASALAEEEGGLPTPPLNERDLLATPVIVELSNIFDGLDDDGNVEDGVELTMCEENFRKSYPKRVIQGSPFKRPNRSPSSHQGPGRESSPGETAKPKHPNSSTTKIQKSLLKKDPVLSRLCKPLNVVPAFPKSKPVAEPKINNEVNVHHKSEKGTIPKKPISHPNEKSKNSYNEPSFGMKLEITKRKLQEPYQEVERAKKQRTVQVMELSDLPKQTIPRGISAATITTSRR